MAKLNILVLHNTFLPDYGGSSIRAYNLLSRVPYNITVSIPEKKGNGEYFKYGNENFNNITVKRVNTFSPNSFWKLPIIRYFNHQKMIFNSAKNEKFDLIQSRVMPPHIITAYKLSKKYNKPLIVEAHPIASKRFQYYMRLKTNKIFKSASHIISLTDALKKCLTEKYKIPEEKITVIKNGLDNKKFKLQDSYQIESLREKLGNPEKIVMYAGYLDDVNGLGMVLKILPSIIKDNPHINFIFVGQGPYFQQIDKISKKYPQIKLIPTVKHNLMPLYYQSSDLFIIPRPSTVSAELVMPLKLLEAMAMESVVLGSDVGGIKEVIENGENGYLFEKGNSDAFKNNLINALENDNSKIGKNARKTILNNFSWDKSAQKLKKVYDECCN